MPMEDTSSNSLDIRGLVDEPQEQSAPTDGFASFVKDLEADEFVRANAAARWARTQDPSAYAEAQRLSPDIPPEIAIRQMELLKNSTALDIYKRVFERSPQLRNYYATQPKKLAFANPDELDEISGLSWLGQAASGAFNLGAREYLASQARIRKAAGKPAIGDDVLLQTYDAEQSRTFGARGWFEKGLVALGRMTPGLMGTAKGAQAGGVVGAAAGGTIGSVVPAIGTTLGLAAGMSAGAIAGAYQSNYDFQRGLMMLEFDKIKDENGQPIDPKASELAANIVGAGVAALDVVSLERLARVIPGAKEMLGAISKDSMKAALRNPQMRQVLTNFAKNTASTSGMEITTELLQQVLQIMGEASLKAQYSAEQDQMTAADAGQQLLDTAIQTAQVMSILGPLAAATRIGADVREIQSSRAVIKNFNDLRTQLADNEFIKRAPAEASAVLDKQLNSPKIYLPAQETVELFQSSGQDVYGPAIPNWRERLGEALRAGGDVEVSLGEYLSYLNTSPVAEPLASLVAAQPGGYNSGQIAEYMSALDNMLKSEAELARDKGTPVQSANGGPVTPGVYAPQIEAMRKPLRRMFNQQTADFYVDVIGSHYNAMAERVWMTPEQLYNERPFEIQFGEEADSVDPNELFQQAMASEEFNNWFGNSVARDAEGRPLTVYHGTNASFDAFDASKAGSQTQAKDAGKGFFFATNPEVASGYADNFNFYKDTRLGRILEKVTWGLYSKVTEGVANRIGVQSGIAKGGNVMPVNLRISNPLEIDLGGSEYNEQTFDSAITQAKAEGRDGVVFRNVVDTGFRGEDKSTDVYVAFDPTQIKSVFNRGTYDRNDPNVLNQDKRGSIRFVDNKALIRLFGQSDVSTLLHEFSHFFLENLKEMSKASPAIAEDYEIVKKALGITGDTITREQHEKFAKMGEAYFYKGKAPSRALERAFMAFKALLKALYRNLKNLGGNISPEVSEVFDRMLATEAQLDQMEQDAAYAPLFKSAAEMGVEPDEYLRFQEIVDKQRVTARSTATEALVGSIQQRNKGWQKKEFNEFKAQARERLKTLPPYSHRATLASGRLTIDVKALTSKYSKNAVKKFPAAGLRTNGLDPQIAAELLGYPTADDMVHDFVTAPTLEEASATAAREEMARRYEGHANESELLDAQVQQAMAQDGRVYALGLELQALSKKADKEAPASIAAQAATKLARDTVWSKAFKDLNPKLARANLRKAGSMKFAAAARGDWQGAANWARKQMLAQAIVNEITKAEKAVEKVRAKARKYSKLKSTSVDPEYVEQILRIVGQYEFTNVSGNKLKSRADLRSFIERKVAEGAVFVQLPDRLLRDVSKVNYKELSIEDLIGIGETIDNLEHLGRLKGKLKARDAANSWALTKQQILDQLKKLPSKPVKMKTLTQTDDGWFANDEIAKWMASLLKPEQIISWLDMDDIQGNFMENVFQPIADAQAKQNELALKYNEKLMKIFEELDSDYLKEIIRVDAIGKNMTREEIYAVALNTGTESNRQKLLKGELWNEGQLEAILTNLTEKDWNRIQKTWNLLDGLWPEIAAMYKRLTGIEPPKVEARGFVNVHGEFAGGYYPIVYDFDSRRGMNLIEDTTPESDLTPDKLFDNTSFKYVGTNNKYTVKRTMVAKPLRLSLSVLPGHIHTVIHDLAYREPVRAAYKILWDPDIRQGIIDTQGKHVYSQLQHWLGAVASERSLDPDPNAPWIARLRTGTTIYAMGFRLSTVLAQPLGLFNAMVKVRSKYLGPAVLRVAMHPLRTVKAIQATSPEMRDRFNQMDRDIRDNIKKLGEGETKLDIIRRYAFWMIGKMDMFVATATWMGAYNQAVAQDGLSDEMARRFADRTVRLTQGTGHMKDMAKVMTSSETSKLLTMFYSAFSAQYNMQVDLTRKTSDDIRSGEFRRVLMERLPQWFFLIVCPAVFGALIGGDTPEDDESYAAWVVWKSLMYPLNALPVVRDVASAVQRGQDYAMTPAARAVDSSIKAVSRVFHWDKEGNFDPKLSAVKAGAEAGSILFKLPTGQAITSVSSIWEGLEKGDMKLKDPLFGRQGR